MRLWYAVMTDREDDDWGYGCFDKELAISWMHELNEEFSAKGINPEAYIAVIDAGYDEHYNATADPLCIDEIEDLKQY